MRIALLWLMFFAICLGLGYPTLNRYDPRLAPGTRDAEHYGLLVTGWRLDPAAAGEHSNRILIPYAAKPFYLLAKGRIGSWDPVLFGLLVSTSFFCATCALLLTLIGEMVAHDRAVGLLAGVLYLSNFMVANSHLCGAVDAGEGCAIAATAFCILKRRFAFLPLVAVLGALAKETFVPIAGAFALAWWWGEKSASKQGAWTAAMIAAGLAAVTISQSAMAGALIWPWSFAAGHYGDADLWPRIAEPIFNRGTVYAFGWLLPLGVWRLGDLPAGWARATACSAAVVWAMSAFHGTVGADAARPFFNAAGPLLCLSSALLLSHES